MTIKEQITYLDKAWKVVPLRGRSKTESIRNRRLIKKFQNEGSTLGRYLRESAWEEDQSGSNRVYLVMNRSRRKENSKSIKWEIVGYFALRSGLLYVPEPERRPLEKHEELFMNILTKAQLMGGLEGLFFLLLASKVYPKERLLELKKLWDEKHLLYEDQLITKEAQALRVANIFPGVEITHLCRNDAYQMPEGIDIKFAPYVFWEHIVPKVLTVSDQIGAQYLYLFAAENHPQKKEDSAENHPQKKEDSAENHPQKKEDASESLSQAASENDRNMSAEEYQAVHPNRLINMYANDCSFRLIEGINILKPAYDYRCFSMIQDIKDLRKNRISFWSRLAEEVR